MSLGILSPTFKFAKPLTKQQLKSRIAKRRLNGLGAASADGRTYTVEAGDGMAKIAKKVTGVESKWPELIAANPKKATTIVSGSKVFTTLFAGEVLNLPASWVTAVAPSSPAETAVVTTGPSDPLVTTASASGSSNAKTMLIMGGVVVAIGLGFYLIRKRAA